MATTDKILTWIANGNLEKIAQLFQDAALWPSSFTLNLIFSYKNSIQATVVKLCDFSKKS